MRPVAGTSTPKVPPRVGRAWLGLALRTIGTSVVVVAALCAVLGLGLLFDPDPEVRGGGVVLLVASLLAAGAGVLARRAARRCGPTPSCDVLTGVVMIVGAAIGWVLVPLAVVAGGTWLVVAMLRSDAELPARMVGIALGVVAVGLMVLVSVGFLQALRGVPAPHENERPAVGEWVVAGLVVGLAAVLLAAGVLDLRSSGGVSLLVGGLVAVVAAAGPAGGVLQLWWVAHRWGRARDGAGR